MGGKRRKGKVQVRSCVFQVGEEYRDGLDKNISSKLGLPRLRLL